jgi:hypothetical protein
MLTSGRLLRCRRHILGIDGVETWTTLARQSAKEVNLWLWTADPRHATVLSPPNVSRNRHASEFYHVQLDVSITEHITAQIRTIRTRSLSVGSILPSTSQVVFVVGIVYVMHGFVAVTAGVGVLQNLTKSRRAIQKV